MLDACERIALYIQGFNEDTFAEDLRTVDAVCMNLVRIGEGANGLPASVRALADDLPWMRIISLRHRIAHSYSGLEVDKIWLTAVTSTPKMAERLRAILGRG